MTDFLWPPSYTLLRHPRAKQVKLRFCEQRGLMITIPKRYSVKHIPSILEEQKNWIVKHCKTFSSVNQLILPETISILFCQKLWKITYHSFTTKVKLLEKMNNELAVIGNLANKEIIRRFLVKWLKSYVSPYFHSLLKQVSENLGLPFSSLLLRIQKTMWGSCSVDHKINLNYKLLFLPLTLVRYVMIHELCHTIHHDHSENFWRLVAHYEPNYRQCRKELKKVNHLIPHWFY